MESPKTEANVQFFRDHNTDDASYSVYLRKVRYDTTAEDDLVGDKKAHLQWKLEEQTVIKHGTVSKLVEAMCSSSGDLDATFVDVLLATYRSFTTPKILMELILARYEDVVEDQSLQQQVQESCRRSIRTALTAWLDKYPDDFNEPPSYSTLSLLDNFAEENFPDGDLHPKVRDKLTAYRNSAEEPDYLSGPVDDLAVIIRWDIVEAVWSEHRPKLKQPLDILSVPARTFAEQLTYMDAELFRKVVPHHCLGSVWSRRNDKKCTVQPVTVFATVEQFNAVSYRVIATILKWPFKSIPQRVLVIEKWIDIAQECRQLKNFSSLKAIISGLQSSSVFRLKKVWQSVSKDREGLFKELANIFSEENNQSLWRDLLNREGTAKFVDPEAMSMYSRISKKKTFLPKQRRTAVHEIMSPTMMHGTVPYLGTFLTDLTMVDTAFKDFVNGNMINFEKKRKEFELLAQIQMLQSTAALYRITPDSNFYDWFYGIRIYDDNESHELSQEIEPSDHFGMTVDRRRHKKSSSLGYFSTRRRMSTEDMNFFQELMSKTDEDSRSVQSMKEYHQTSPRPISGYGHSISMCSIKSLDRVDSSHLLDSSESIAVKVNLQVSESHHTNNYKSILLSNTDHATNVLRNILAKFNILGKPEDFSIFQLLPDNTELALPERGNIFYAIKRDTLNGVNFVVRKRTHNERSKLKSVKGRKEKNRLSRIFTSMSILS